MSQSVATYDAVSFGEDGNPLIPEVRVSSRSVVDENRLGGRPWIPEIIVEVEGFLATGVDCGVLIEL